jgi:hypothetical protein
MEHLENKTSQEVILDQIQDLFRQSFILGERAVIESAKRNGLSESETKELLISNGIPVGMEFLKQITGVAQILERTSPKEVDKMVESIDLVLDEVRKRNKSV